MQSETSQRTSGAGAASEPAPERRKVSVAVFNFWLDVLLGCSVSFLMWVSAMIQMVFPPASRSEGWKLWGWTYDQWRNAQFGAVCVCVLLALEHVVMHWNWVCGVITTKMLRLKKRPDEAVQKLYGIAFFFMLMGIAFAGLIAATFMVKQPQP
jgi:hypothetical protein